MSVVVRKTHSEKVAGYDIGINRISSRSAILTRDNFRIWAADPPWLLTVTGFGLLLRVASAVSLSSATRNRLRNDTAKNAIAAKMILIATLTHASLPDWIRLSVRTE
jgi:hypothetical protein